MRSALIFLSLLIAGCSNLDSLEDNPFNSIDDCEDYILEGTDGKLGCYETRPWFAVSQVGTDFFSEDWIYLSVQAAEEGSVTTDHLVLDFYTTIHEEDEPNPEFISSLTDRLFVVYPDGTEHSVLASDLGSYPATIEIGGTASPNIDVEAGDMIDVILGLDTEGLDDYVFIVQFKEAQEWSSEDGTFETLFPEVVGAGMGISQ